MSLQRPPRPPTAQRQQQGLVLVYAMIALVLMLIAGAALIRSMNTALFNAGNLGFKRDLSNQGDRVLQTVIQQATTGLMATEVSRQQSNPAANYSAILLPSNANNLPLALLTDQAFAAVGSTANDILLDDQKVEVRYIVDRLCLVAGPATSANCSLSGEQGMSGYELAPPVGAASRAIYRVSIRVSGPRNTQSFFQATFSQ